MLRRGSILLILLTLLGSVAAYRWLRPAASQESVSSVAVQSEKPEKVPATPRPEPPKTEPEPEVDPPPAPTPPRSQRVVTISQERVQSPLPAPSARKTEPTESMRERARRYWQQQAAHFNRLLQRLEDEQDPARRQHLIQSLARYIRVNTLETLDWAMALEDPNEKRAALEAINEYALSGIGARIGTDPSGRPVIRDTTPLSAIGSTGQVEPGDTIAGIINPDGSTTYFQDMPLHEVVRRLRGEPGSKAQLILERTPDQGGAPYTFDLVVPRSMLVVEPPY